MKIVSYLTEPASYTIDLVSKVHKPLGIDYRFLQRKTLAKTDHFLEDSVYMQDKSWLDRVLFIKRDYEKYDVIVFNGYDRLDFLFLLFIHLLSSNKKNIGLESDTQLRIPTNFLKRLIKKLYLNFIFKNNHIHALAGGNNTHRKLFSYYGMKEKNIHFLPMVIDVEKRNFKIDRQRNSTFTFLFVGRFIPLKQIEYIIKSFLLEFENDSNIQLKLVGEGPLLKHLKDKYKFENVFFEGAQYDEILIDTYKKSHVLVLASNKEQWGLVINEALASGLAVLSNNKVGANYDLIEGKDTGYVFDSNSDSDLSIKMRSIYQDEKYFKQCCMNAHHLMHGYWNFKLYSEKLLEASTKMMLND
jgi:glycosyltransferase involved in cell wall biosynthesis